MSAWWNDYRPAVHPQFGSAVHDRTGQREPDLRTLKLFFGHWSTEGVNAVDYFQNLGEITWAADMKAWLKPTSRWCTCSESTTAARRWWPCCTVRERQLGGYPWSLLRNEALGMTRLDYAGMPVEQALPYPRDIVVERDFARGNADQYHVIFDANTVFMDETLINRIEAGSVAAAPSSRRLKARPDATHPRKLMSGRSRG